MEVFKTIADIRAFSRRARAEGKTVGFVPTMGALHAGHEALIRTSVKECDITIVSIFVNPAQFDDGTDLEKYPRTLKADKRLCQDLGADAVFIPDEDDIYDGGSLIMISVAHLADQLCGMSRPGHFRGVLLVVAKLFNIVEPDRAYFGEKDIQQLTIIRQMIKDLNFPIHLAAVPLVREKDGLAMSSRNTRLSPKERTSALKLGLTLTNISRRVRELEEVPEDERPPVSEVLADFAEELVSDPLIELDYISAVDVHTLTDVVELRKGTIFAIAAFVGDVRLIDNWIYR